MLFYENGKRIYKNLHGKEIPPHLWKSVNTFHEGLVTVVDENDHYGFADEEENLVFPPKWDYACYFEKGYAYVKDGDHHFFILQSRISCERYRDLKMAKRMYYHHFFEKSVFYFAFFLYLCTEIING